eukprot:gene12618-26569_t
MRYNMKISRQRTTVIALATACIFLLFGFQAFRSIFLIRHSDKNYGYEFPTSFNRVGDSAGIAIPFKYDSHEKHCRMTWTKTRADSALTTFVVPSSGRASLKHTLEGLVNQNDPNWLAIVIINVIMQNKMYSGFSNIPIFFDLSQNIQKDSRICFIIQPTTPTVHNCAGSIRNQAMNLVTTPWVSFVDDDDTVDSKYVERLQYEINDAKPDRLDCIIFRMTNGELIIPPPEHTDFIRNYVENFDKIVTSCENDHRRATWPLPRFIFTQTYNNNNNINKNKENNNFNNDHNNININDYNNNDDYIKGLNQSIIKAINNNCMRSWRRPVIDIHIIFSPEEKLQSPYYIQINMEQALETHRINPLLQAGKVVIAVTSSDKQLDSLYSPYVILSHTDRLLSTTVDILEHYDHYRSVLEHIGPLASRKMKDAIDPFNLVYKNAEHTFVPM